MPIKEILEMLSEFDVSTYPDTRKEGICYSIFPVICDGALGTCQLEITISNTLFSKCVEISNNIIKKITTLGDLQDKESITYISQSGGGCYKDNDLNVYKMKVNFAVNYRLH